MCSLSSGRQESEIQVLEGPCSLSKALGEDPSCFFQLPVVPGAPWLVVTSLQCLLPSSYDLSPLCLCLNSPSDLLL